MAPRASRASTSVSRLSSSPSFAAARGKASAITHEPEFARDLGAVQQRVERRGQSAGRTLPTASSSRIVHS